MLVLALALAAAACTGSTAAVDDPAPFDRAEYADAVRGSWTASVIANHSGIALQGLWIDEPSDDDSIELLFLDQWSTDDDTHVEWLDLHILETHGLNPTYEQVRDEWIDHLNGDIWVATRAARDLMSQGVLPPDTGGPELNPDGAWSMDAQLETELFGLINPGNPDRAREQAIFFAEVTNSGPAVDASAFYAHLYSIAFGATDVRELVARARAGEPEDSIVAPIVDAVTQWHAGSPNDWRVTREKIREAYDDDPAWWASRVNFATTIMALLYGNGDLGLTIDIAGLAGWDADNNMTTSAGLIGAMLGFTSLPEPFRSASDIYFNEDLTNLEQFDSIENIAQRTVALGVAGRPISADE